MQRMYYGGICDQNDSVGLNLGDNSLSGIISLILYVLRDEP